MSRKRRAVNEVDDVLDADALEAELAAELGGADEGAEAAAGEESAAEKPRREVYCRRFYQIKLTREQALLLKETAAVLRARGAEVRYGTHRGGEEVNDEYDAIRWLVENAEKLTADS